MRQDEIFKLLLIILLLISGDDCESSCHSLTGNLNSIIIIMLLLGLVPFGGENGDGDTTTFR